MLYNKTILYLIANHEDAFIKVQERKNNFTKRKLKDN